MKATLAVFLLAGVALLAPEDPIAYEFNPPAFPADGEGLVWQHFLPPADGFAANVNLLIQPFEGTIAQYDELSKTQFAQLNLTVIRSEQQEDEVLYEYHGTLSGQELHWYARAFKRADRIYLVTATALQARWEDEGPILVESVNGFSLK